ncbi:helix-turn-helix domain-containing protein [Hansschlegelia plantiphila]|uniref:HTH cro/C1-type domain-containing protein n=1 Tax=Hansschlegelia plantiphila TaxID=374655 RepID=A0A9W6MXD7_9HYPH|nr:hypothetical protein GCM10008179_34280 [Hansschlegelia plantiphila]
MLGQLVDVRKAAGVTQAELGRRVGRRQTFISKVELGERRLDVAEFINLGRAIGADPYALMRKVES